VATQVLAATPVASAQDLVLQGTVVLPPQAVYQVSAPLTGVVQKVWVSPGQGVRAGQPVASLLSPQLMEWQRDLMQAQAQAQLAASKLERDEKLFAEGIIAELRLQDTRNQNQLAQLALNERRQALQLVGAGGHPAALAPGLTLNATATGTVLEVLATPGQRLEAGMPVAKMARAGLLVLELQATAAQARMLHIGDRLGVEGCQTPARLSAISPQVTVGNQAVLLRAELSSKETCVRVNQFVQVRVTGGEMQQASTMRVPAVAVVRQAGKTHVFVRTSKGFVPMPVVLEAGGAGDSLSVRSGLNVGDAIVVQGVVALKGAWLGLGSGGQ
jgi:RND family efflux transporter MFP subunit